MVLLVFLLVYFTEEEAINFIYEGRIKIKSELERKTTSFTDSNICCPRCGNNIIYYKDYHVISIMIFYVLGEEH